MEKEYIRALRDGNHKAFEKIFICYFKRVKLFICGIIKSEADAEELAQEVFVKLWTNREALEIDKPFGGYLYTIAKNAAFNLLKHKSVKQSYAECNHLANDVATPEEVLFAREINLLIEMTVSEMPIQRQKIYRYSRERGLSNSDISEKLGISKKTVENQLSLALHEIRKIISLFFILFS
jgi:RNA polymerase sigma-70 factor, ECF subfamily